MVVFGVIFPTPIRHCLLIVCLWASPLFLYGEESVEELGKTNWAECLTVTLGGISAEDQIIGISCWHDPKSGYYLLKTTECDSAHVAVILTKDRRIVTKCGFEVAGFGRKPEYGSGEIVEHRKIDLITKNGIHIGMTRKQVEQKLGKPNRTAVRGGTREYWCMLYKKVAMEDKKIGRVLRNTYIFKHDKLIEISINLDSVPGCGDDDHLSDANWPWSEF
ncbi:MAG: hypothetical protein ACK49N_12215 [Verrucomicrobiota bacterium]